MFMAVAEKVGHDRRGNNVYERDADGAEIVRSKTKSILTRRVNRDIVTEIAVREKEIDDDLPRVGIAYRTFRSTGRVDEE